jgi:hypothetical protein
MASTAPASSKGSKRLALGMRLTWISPFGQVSKGAGFGSLWLCNVFLDCKSSCSDLCEVGEGVHSCAAKRQERNGKTRGVRRDAQGNALVAKVEQRRQITPRRQRQEGAADIVDWWACIAMPD